MEKPIPLCCVVACRWWLPERVRRVTAAWTRACRDVGAALGALDAYNKALARSGRCARVLLPLANYQCKSRT